MNFRIDWRLESRSGCRLEDSHYSRDFAVFCYSGVY